MWHMEPIVVAGQSAGGRSGILIIIGIAILVFALVMLKFARLWLQAYFSRADVRLSELIGMWLRKVDMRTIVLSKITAVQAGLKLTTKDLESHYLAGGPGAERRAGAHRGRPRQYRSVAQDGHGHRPGRPRHPRRHSDQRQSRR